MNKKEIDSNNYLLNYHINTLEYVSKLRKKYHYGGIHEYCVFKYHVIHT